MRQMAAAAALAMSIATAGAAQAADGVTVFSDGPNHQGFNDPRGVKFGPDGYLYVAEAGLGGTNSTAGQCAQVPGPRRRLFPRNFRYQIPRWRVPD